MTSLTSDQRGLLSERLLRELGRTDERINEQEHAVQDAPGADRIQAERVLLGLRRWAASHLMVHAGCVPWPEGYGRPRHAMHHSSSDQRS